MKMRLSLLLACAAMLISATWAATPAAAYDLSRGLRMTGCSTAGQDSSQPRLELVLVGVVVLIVIVRRVIPMLGGGGGTAAKSAFGRYGPAGGAICPRCGQIFARQLLSPNLVTGKLSRCPHCGKWSIVAAASPTVLAAAEAAQRGPAGEPAEATDAPPNPEEKLRRQIEDSKYER